MSNIFFIWVPGFKAPTCEILYGLDQNVDSHSRQKKPILQKHELPIEHKDLTLNQLALIYPYEGKDEKGSKEEITKSF